MTFSAAFDMKFKLLLNHIYSDQTSVGNSVLEFYHFQAMIHRESSRYRKNGNIFEGEKIDLFIFNDIRIKNHYDGIHIVQRKNAKKISQKVKEGMR